MARKEPARRPRGGAAPARALAWSLVWILAHLAVGCAERPLPRPQVVQAWRGRPAGEVLRSLYEPSVLDPSRTAIRVGIASGAQSVSIASEAGLRIDLEDVEGRLVLVPVGAEARIELRDFEPGDSAPPSPDDAPRKVLAPPTGRLDILVEGRVVVSHRGAIRVQPARGPGPAARVRVEGGSGAAANGTARRYPGALWCLAGWDGSISVVNEVDIASYLEGLVPYEIFPESPLEALKAQAVVARGQILFALGASRHPTDPFDLCSEVHCQVYRGEPPDGPCLENIRRAVAETDGLHLARSGVVLNSVYSACCGGHTEAGDKVWGGPIEPSLRGGLDAPGPLGLGEWDLAREPFFRRWVAARPKTWCSVATLGKLEVFRWLKAILAADLDSKVAACHPNLGRVLSLGVLERGVSGRAVKLEIVGERGRATVEGELAIRRLFGGLKSSAFVVDVVKDRRGKPFLFVLNGAGWGHGVGMCQTGAVGMAEGGFSYREILGHYYPGADLVPLGGEGSWGLP